MDLISREALREAMYHEAFEMDSDMQKWDSGCWIRYKMFENRLKDAPSVPAVPLEPLANWLAEYAAPPVSECCVTADERTAAWKAVLNKFVEEQQDD